MSLVKDNSVHADVDISVEYISFNECKRLSHSETSDSIFCEDESKNIIRNQMRNFLTLDLNHWKEIAMSLGANQSASDLNWNSNLQTPSNPLINATVEKIDEQIQTKVAPRTLNFDQEIPIKSNDSLNCLNKSSVEEGCHYFTPEKVGAPLEHASENFPQSESKGKFIKNFSAREISSCIKTSTPIAGTKYYDSQFINIHKYRGKKLSIGTGSFENFNGSQEIGANDGDDCVIETNPSIEKHCCSSSDFCARISPNDGELHLDSMLSPISNVREIDSVRNEQRDGKVVSKLSLKRNKRKKFIYPDPEKEERFAENAGIYTPSLNHFLNGTLFNNTLEPLSPPRRKSCNNKPRNLSTINEMENESNCEMDLDSSRKIPDNAICSRSQENIARDEVDKISQKEINYASNLKIFQTSTSNIKTCNVTESRKVALENDTSESNIESSISNNAIPATNLRKQSFNATLINDDSFAGFCGFTSASGKNISVSEDSLCKIKSMWENELGGSTSINETGEKNNVEGKSASFSVKDGILGTCVPSALKVGFQSASGKNISISDASLEKVKNLWDQSNLEDSEINDTSMKNSRTSSIYSKTLKPKPNCLDKNTLLSENTNVSIPLDTFSGPFENDTTLSKVKGQGDQNSYSEFPSFFSANGKKVDVSQVSLSKAKKVFETFEETFCENKENKFQKNVGEASFNDLCENSLASSKCFETSKSNVSIRSPVFPSSGMKARTLNTQKSLSCSDSIDESVSSILVRNISKDDSLLPKGQDVNLENKESTFTPNTVESEFPASGVSNATQRRKSSPVFGSGRLKGRSQKRVWSSGEQANNSSAKSCKTSDIGSLSQNRTSYNELCENSLGSSKCFETCKSNVSIRSPVFPSKSSKTSDIGSFSQNRTPEDNECCSSRFSQLRTIKNCKMDSSPSLATRNIRLENNHNITLESEPNISTEFLAQDSKLELQSSSFLKKNSHQNVISSSSISQKATEIEEITKAFLLDTSWDGDNVEFASDRECAESSTSNMCNYTISERNSKREKQKKDLELSRMGGCTGNVSSGKGSLYREKLNNKSQLVPLKSLTLSKKSGTQNGNSISITLRNTQDIRFNTDEDQRGVSLLCEDDGVELIPGDDGRIGWQELEMGFLTSREVDCSLIPKGWVQNHYRWILWKLIAMAVKLDHHFNQTPLLVTNVVRQLRYRYDVEICEGRRSALRKISEQDEAPNRTMVLCVAEIERSTSSSESSYCVTLTDGWYSVGALVDPAFERLVDKRRIKAGTKLIIHGAQIVGQPPAAHPLQGSELKIKIQTNMIRESRWYTRLGFVTGRSSVPSSTFLSCILPDGGLVPTLDLLLCRKYPLVYMEKIEGKKTILNEAVGRSRLRQMEIDKDKLTEKIFFEVEKELSSQFSCEATIKLPLVINASEVAELNCGEKISYFMEMCSDPSLLEALSQRQIELARGWMESQKSRRQQQISQEVSRRIRNLNDEAKHRELVPMLKLGVLDSKGNEGFVNIWRPHDELLTCLEGNVYRFRYLMATGVQHRRKKLSFCRQTLWGGISKTFELSCERRTTSLSSLAKHQSNSDVHFPAFGEIDFVGVVVRSVKRDQGEFVHIGDSTRKVVAYLKFHPSCEDYKCSALITPGNVVSFSNVFWKNDFEDETPLLLVTPHTVITTSPEATHLKTAFVQFKVELEKTEEPDPKSCNEGSSTGGQSEIGVSRSRSPVLKPRRNPRSFTPKFSRNETNSSNGNRRNLGQYFQSRRNTSLVSSHRANQAFQSPFRSPRDNRHGK